MILLDTNVLVSLVDERDGLHPRAARDLAAARKQPLAVTGLILGETCFLLSQSHQRGRLRFLLDRLQVQDIELEPPWRDDVFAWLEQYQDHEPDLADAQLAVLCSRRKDCRVWSYDREFRTTWRSLEGGRIPLFKSPVGG